MSPSKGLHAHGALHFRFEFETLKSISEKKAQ
jgi:hypothetical protein